MAPLALKLRSREARTALAAAYTSAAGLLPGPAYARGAALLTDLCAWSTTAIDEPDYEARMRGAAALQSPVWLLLGRVAVSVFFAVVCLLVPLFVYCEPRQPLL
jgi:hypothetical protein